MIRGFGVPLRAQAGALALVPHLLAGAQPPRGVLRGRAAGARPGGRLRRLVVPWRRPHGAAVAGEVAPGAELCAAAAAEAATHGRPLRDRAPKAREAGEMRRNPVDIPIK